MTAPRTIVTRCTIVGYRTGKQPAHEIVRVGFAGKVGSISLFDQFMYVDRELPARLFRIQERLLIVHYVHEDIAQDGSRPALHVFGISRNPQVGVGQIDRDDASVFGNEVEAPWGRGQDLY